MKKFIFILMVALIFGISDSFAQNSGLGFNYQALVRKSDGVLLANSKVSLRISLYPGQSALSPTWVETHTVKTDASGCFGITIGKGTRQTGSVVSQFKDINFAAVYYWLKIEVQEGSTYRELTFSQLPSTPYSEVAHNAGIPAGIIVPFGGPKETIPEGWLLCDGAAVSRTKYANLFKAIGVAWGIGDGSTSFHLPNLQGLFLRGVAGETDLDPDKDTRIQYANKGGNSGNNVGSYQTDAIRNIIGSVVNGGRDDEGPLSGSSAGFNAFKTTPTGGNGAAGVSAGGGFGFDFDASRVVPVGGDNRPKNAYVNYIIKF